MPEVSKMVSVQHYMTSLKFDGVKNVLSAVKHLSREVTAIIIFAFLLKRGYFFPLKKMVEKHGGLPVYSL